MKNYLVCFLLFCFSSINLFSQPDCSVPVSSHSEDQIFQGPCFVFAAVAAIEARSIDNINLSEWYYWNSCVMNGVPGDGGFMIEKVVEHANLMGALYQEDFYEVTIACEENDIPNHPNSLCLFDCNNDDWCKDVNSSCPIGLIEMDEGFEVCEYEGAFFAPSSSFSEFLEVDLTLQNIELGSNVDKIANINDQLCANNGVILFINDYTVGSDDPAPVHCVFVYGVDGDELIYKDSWPGNPSSARKRYIDPVDIDRAFIVEGTVSNAYCGVAPTCECELVGPDVVDGPTTFTIEGHCDGTRNWIIPNSLDVVSGGLSKHKKVTVRPNSCIETTETILVEFSGCLPISKEVTITPELPETPTDILMLSLELCPNSLVEFTVIDNNPYNPANIYEWEIIGAGTIASGQGSSTIFVNTNNSKFGFITLSVRITNECGFSGKYSETFNFDQNCGGIGNEGDINLRQSTINSGPIKFYPNPTSNYIQIADDIESVRFEIFSQYGKKVKSGLTKFIDVSDLSAGVYIIRSYDSEKHATVGKFMKVN